MGLDRAQFRILSGIKGDDTPTLMTDGCGNLQCEQGCFHSADLRCVRGEDI